MLIVDVDEINYDKLFFVINHFQLSIFVINHFNFFFTSKY